MPINENGLYTFEERNFINTREYTRTRQNYEKYGYYTDAPEGSKDWWDFWKEEGKRRREGYSVGGVRITGEHYGYLNYGRILMTTDNEDDALVGVKALTNRQRKSGTKRISFPDFWDGDFHWFNAKEEARNYGLHICCGKARRKGFSYKNSVLAEESHGKLACCTHDQQYSDIYFGKLVKNLLLEQRRKEKENQRIQGLIND